MVDYIRYPASDSGVNTGDVTLASVGSTPSANGASLSGQILTLQPADSSNPGIITAGTQTIAGNKTFSGTLAASNLSGTNTGNQTITLTGDVTGSGTGTFATTAASVISARYFASSTTISGALATINWTTQDFDSNSAMSSGTYTIPKAGKYQINVALLIAGTISLNNQAVIEIQKNGTVVSRETTFFAATLTDGRIRLNDIINCALNDTIRIQVSTTVVVPTIVSSNFDNFFSIARLGA